MPGIARFNSSSTVSEVFSQTFDEVQTTLNQVSVDNKPQRGAHHWSEPMRPMYCCGAHNNGGERQYGSVLLNNHKGKSLLRVDYQQGTPYVVGTFTPHRGNYPGAALSHDPHTDKVQVSYREMGDLYLPVKGFVSPNSVGMRPIFDDDLYQPDAEIGSLTDEKADRIDRVLKWIHEGREVFTAVVRCAEPEQVLERSSFGLNGAQLLLANLVPLPAISDLVRR